MRTAILSLIFALGLLGCAPVQTVLPNPKVAHRIAQPVKVKVWLRRGDTKEFQEVEVEFAKDWLIVPPDWGEK